mgnify:FL=1|tara:strand:+ start:143 stop:460 length:318 start_codon:yes stop_codon:yes gene_type:complete
MTTQEIKKILLIIFHVIALMFLFVSTSLLLDDIFKNGLYQTNEVDSFAINIPALLSLFTIFIGFISWLIIIVRWIRNSKLEFYMKSIFITKTILIIGSVILLTLI